MRTAGPGAAKGYVRKAAFALALAGVVSPVRAADQAAERLPACQGCHGAGGTSEMTGVPSLGGQMPDYLLVQLVVFRSKQRVVEAMNAITDGLSDDDLRTLADTMAKQPAPKPAEPALDATLAAQGRDLSAKYRCNSCHGATFAGQDQIPRLAGQREDYLAKSLTDYKSNARAGYDPAMNEVAAEVQAADIPVLAKYLAAYR